MQIYSCICTHTLGKHILISPPWTPKMLKRATQTMDSMSLHPGANRTAPNPQRHTWQQHGPFADACSKQRQPGSPGVPFEIRKNLHKRVSKIWGNAFYIYAPVFPTPPPPPLPHGPRSCPLPPVVWGGLGLVVVVVVGVVVGLVVAVVVVVVLCLVVVIIVGVVVVGLLVVVVVVVVVVLVVVHDII